MKQIISTFSKLLWLGGCLACASAQTPSAQPSSFDPGELRLDPE
jgi:hypothetical protein